MKLRSLLVPMLLCLGAAGGALAADHIDSPSATASPAADITDLFAWMTSDGAKLNLVVDVHPFATAESMWSDAVVYAVHVSSVAQYGGALNVTKTVLCHFYKADGTGIECWLGDEYVAGDPSATAGLSSASGKLKVFAGLRDDPFFFELTGFQNAVATVSAAASSLDFDANGCPAVSAATSAALVGALSSGDGGAPASNTLAGANVLSLVVQLDKSLVNSGGPVLAAWAGTYQKQ